jgi:hypothetical protein
MKQIENVASTERSPDVRRLFEQKKIKVVAPTVHINTLKIKARTFVNLRKKKANVDAFLATVG